MLKLLENGIKFLKETRDEVRRVVWPKRKEITVIGVVAGIAVAIAAVFFLVVDFLVYRAIDFFINF